MAELGRDEAQGRRNGLSCPRRLPHQKRAPEGALMRPNPRAGNGT
jgi:hypothetical protein